MATDDATSVGERLDELLSQWQARAARGRDVPAAELCPDRPELAAELEKRIRVTRAVGAIAQPDETTVRGPLRPPGPEDPAGATIAGPRSGGPPPPAGRTAPPLPEVP